ncbi:MAG: restriction endonuclease subunit S [Desulfurococcales archaeon]|nr:restriction endonuclease subunit S [Desulfurococcales archaeon]
MITEIIKFNTLLDKCRRLNINYIKLNPLSMLSAARYTKLLTTLMDNGFEVINLTRDHGFEVTQAPRFAWEKFRRTYLKCDTIVYGAGSLWKLTTHPLKGTFSPKPKEVYLVKDTTLLVTRTGRINVSGLFLKEHNQLITELLEVEHTAFTEDLLRVISNDRKILKYVITFLNSSFGYDLSNIAWFGALQPHLDPKIIEKIPIPLAPISIRSKIVGLLTSAYELEIKAWRAYFKAMKIVKEYFDKTERSITGIVRIRDIRNFPYFRVDPSRPLASDAVSRLVKEYSGRVRRISDLFEVRTAGVPREKKYKIRKGQYPLITIDSIDESGIIDYEKIYYMTRKGEPCPKGSILLVKDGASIGKASILPYDAYVMQGIATLVPKPNVDETLKYYVFALLKSSFYRRTIEALGYGATVQYSITKDELESLEIPIMEGLANEVSKHMKEFIEKMYDADKLKMRAISELEGFILRLLG